MIGREIVTIAGLVGALATAGPCLPSPRAVSAEVHPCDDRELEHAVCVSPARRPDTDGVSNRPLVAE
jgi:hypothetical protein